MTDGTTRRYNDWEVVSGVQRRRRWKPEEKVQIVEETYLQGMTVSLVSRQHRISGSQVFTWRRLMSQGALAAAAGGEEVVPASEYSALKAQVRELHRLLGKGWRRRSTSLARIYPQCATEHRQDHEDDRRCRTPNWSPISSCLSPTCLPRPSWGSLYGYHRAHDLLRRQAEKVGRALPNPKRVYRVMKVHGMLLQRDGERREERRHDGRVVVDQRNTR
jgi:transposase